MKNRLNNILREIRAGKCILVIGPDVHDFGDKTFFELFCQELPLLEGHERVLENTDKFSQYFFLNEDLIEIRRESKSELRLADLVQQFYEKQTVLDEPLRKVAQIPFPMIISLMPDDRLCRAFDDLHLPYEFSYCPIDETLPVDVEPNRDKPLIYNLLGNLDSSETVMTFDAMFRLLSNVLKNGLPDVVGQNLKRAKAVLFLGVHFERWHTQLLLKMISAGGYNYTITKESQANVSTFVSERLQLDLLDSNPEHYLYQLYEACKEANLLKTHQPSPAIGSVFVSYSHRDEMIASRIAAALRQRNVTVIMDQTHLAVGDKIKKFTNEIESVDLFIPLLSSSSLFRPYVIEEIHKALILEKRMFPGLLDDTLLDKHIEQKKDEIFDTEMILLQKDLNRHFKESTPHLDAKREHWNLFNQNFSFVIQQLTDIKNFPVEIKDLEPFVDSVINNLNYIGQYATAK